MKDYSYSYLFQRPRIFKKLFSQNSKEIEKITGFNYLIWNEFHDTLCMLIEYKIKVIENRSEKNTEKFFTLTHRGLKKKLIKLNKDVTQVIDFVFTELSLNSAHVIDLSEAIIDFLDKQLLMKSPSYMKQREEIILNSVFEMFRSIKEEKTEIYRNMHYSESEIDLVITLPKEIIFVEVKHTKRSKLKRLYDQLIIRSNYTKDNEVIKLWNRKKTLELNLDLKGKEILFLGIIYDDPFYKMDKINTQEESLRNKLQLITYFNLEAIIEIITHEQETNRLETLVTFFKTSLKERKHYNMEEIGIVTFGDEVVNFKQFYFYKLDIPSMMGFFEKNKTIIFDMNYDIVDQKYDRIEIQNDITINRPLNSNDF